MGNPDEGGTGGTLSPLGPPVVVLGRHGFLSTALAAALRDRGGTRLRVLGSADVDLTAPGAADRLGSAVDADTVLIVTARARRGADPLATFAAEVAIATSVARCLAERPPRRCVYFSSAAVYGDARDNRDTKECTPPAPNSLYGVAKLTAEGVIGHAADQAGVPLLILRPCMVYGPGDAAAPYGPGSFIRAALRGETVRVFGDGCEVRDYLFVRDLVAITLALALGGARGVFNVATGTSHSFADLLSHLRALVANPFVVESISRDRPKTDQTFDVSKLRETLPAFAFTALRDGLAATVAHATIALGSSVRSAHPAPAA